jgi:hypothetical protein
MTLLNRTLVASLVLASALAWVGCGGRESHQGGQPTATTIPGAPPPAQP